MASGITLLRSVNVITDDPGVNPVLESAPTLSDRALSLLETFRATHQERLWLDTFDSIQRALQLTPPNDANKARRLYVLSLTYRCKYECLHGGIESLCSAIDLLREAVSLAIDEALLFNLYEDLRVVLEYRYNETSNLEDLKQAVQANIDGISHCSDPMRRATCYNNLSEIRRRLSENDRDSNTFELAVQDANQAIAASSKDDPFLPVYYHTLALALQSKRRFGGPGDVESLNREIDARRQCLSLPCPNRQYLPLFLNGYAISLRARFNLLDNIDDLDEALKQYRKLLADPDSVIDKKDRCMYHNNLGLALADKFRRVGDTEQLNRGIEEIYQGLRFAEECKCVSDQTMCLSNLSILLSTRFEHTGASGDLNEAVNCAKEAVNRELRLPNSRWIAARYLNYGNALKMQYLRTEVPEILDECVHQYESASLFCGANTIQYIQVANNLSVALRLRYEDANRADPADLDKAIEVLELLVSAESKATARHFNNMAVSLLARYGRDHAEHDLIDAIGYAQKAVEKTNVQQPVYCAYSINLGELLLYRYQNALDSTDLNEAMTWFTTGLEVESAPATIRIESGQRVATLFEGLGKSKEACKILTRCIQLLPETSTRASDFIDQQHRLSGLTRLGSDACALALNNNESPITAVRLLESGRVVILGRLLDLRTPARDLPKELSDEYEKLRDYLDPPFQYNVLPQLQQPGYVNTAHLRAAELRALSIRIRQINGFEDFGDPAPLSKITGVANLKDVSVISINVNDRRCDAFLFGNGDVIHIPLEVTLADIDRQSSRFRALIGKLTSGNPGIVCR